MLTCGRSSPHRKTAAGLPAAEEMFRRPAEPAHRGTGVSSLLPESSTLTMPSWRQGFVKGLD